MITPAIKMKVFDEFSSDFPIISISYSRPELVAPTVGLTGFGLDFLSITT